MDIRGAQVNMIGQQIRSWNVLDTNVLQAIDGIAREHFVPAPYRDVAFADMQIPISDGQVMLEPKVIARMIDALALTADHEVLEIGTGTGYSTAVLASLCRRVVSLEIDPDVAALARNNLAEAGIRNAEVVENDCFAYCRVGSENAGQFDRALVTGSVPELGPLFLPMVCESGRIVGIQGHDPVMHAVICRGDGSVTNLFETVAPRLYNARESAIFEF